MPTPTLEFMIISGSIAAVITFIVGIVAIIRHPENYKNKYVPGTYSWDKKYKPRSEWEVDHGLMGLATMGVVITTGVAFFVWPLIIVGGLIYGTVIACIKGPTMVREREAKKRKAIAEQVRSQIRELERLARDADELDMPKAAETNRYLANELRKTLDNDND